MLFHIYFWFILVLKIKSKTNRDNIFCSRFTMDIKLAHVVHSTIARTDMPALYKKTQPNNKVEPTNRVLVVGISSSYVLKVRFNLILIVSQYDISK